MNTQQDPKTFGENAVLKTQDEWRSTVEQVKSLGLPPHRDLPKNWDSLAALNCILRRTDKTAHILDAGAELYSMILPWLGLYGYSNLIGINLVFDQTVRRDSIIYEHGDITQAKFGENTLDAITCLSVIEHGVDLRSYFKEMARILKPEGVLITSTDYYAEPIDAKGQTAFGVPIHIFSKNEVLQIFELAEEFDLRLTSAINLDCQEKTVTWSGLNYTFVVFTLQKTL